MPPVKGEGRGATHAYCDACSEDSAIDREGNCLWCGGPTRTRRGGWKRPDRAATRKLTDAQVRALHQAHVQGASMRALGEQVYERVGYASANTAANAISDAFKRLGLPARSRSEGTARANRDRAYPDSPGVADQPAYKRYLRRRAGGYRPCQGVRQQYPRKGEPCGRWAMEGSDFCLQHDPDRRTEVVAHLAAVRAEHPRPTQPHKEERT